MTDAEITPNEEAPPKQMLSNGVYEVLKKVVQLGLPAAGTLYFTLAAIWGLPYAEQVVGTLAAIATFLGVILTISTRSYNASETKYDGTIVALPREGEQTLYSLELNNDPATIPEMKELLFKVDVK